jgi:hypothetical protein
MITISTTPAPPALRRASARTLAASSRRWNRSACGGVSIVIVCAATPGTPKSFDSLPTHSTSVSYSTVRSGSTTPSSASTTVPTRTVRAARSSASIAPWRKRKPWRCASAG